MAPVSAGGLSIRTMYGRMTLVMDRTQDGRPLKMLTVLDEMNTYANPCDCGPTAAHGTDSAGGLEVSCFCIGAARRISGLITGQLNQITGYGNCGGDTRGGVVPAAETGPAETGPCAWDRAELLSPGDPWPFGR